MKPTVAALLLFPLYACSGSQTAPTEIKDGDAAVQKAQHVCSLVKPNSPGQWQATLVKDKTFGDEWHVWFGKDRVEPICGFYGAVVKADGSYTSCRVSACRPAP